MTHGPTKISSKGACIYCGLTDVKLTNEHIVPLSLGGQHVIDKASCLACADITKKFEQDVARQLWGDVRIGYDAPSRRREEKPTHITLIDPDTAKKSKVPYSEYPAPFVFYKMCSAGLLQGFPDTLDISDWWELITVSDDSRIKKFTEKYSTKLTAGFRHVPHSFGRLIAKIGYGQAPCFLELGDFRPICLPYILGEKKNISFVVGGRSEITEPHKDIGYYLNCACFGSSERMMIVSEVRLLANACTPTDHVIVGDVVGGENVERVITKLGRPTMDAISKAPAASRQP